MYRFCGFMFGRMFMMLIPLVIIGLIVFVIFKLYNKGTVGHYHESNDTQRAISILNERFAKGEINEEEYKQKKEMIQRR